MKTTTLIETNQNIQTKHGIAAWIGQMILATVIVGITLFLTAGKLNWVGGWVFLGLNLLTQLLSGLILIPRQPDLIAERSQIREGTKSWDRFFAPAIMIAGTFMVIITAGLDTRFGWGPAVSLPILCTALGVAFICQMFVLWAMSSNRFFATTVRIQEERGHEVIHRGPYQFVRHPGYAGSLIYSLVIPLVLGSWWTFVPALITIALLIVRTNLEDRTLQNELPGYREYAKLVPYRLLRGVW